MFRHVLRTALLSGWFFAVLCGPAVAMSVNPPSFSELVDESASIVRARVVSIESRRVPTPAGDAIKTFVTFRVDKALKGAPDGTVTLSFLGGQVGDERWEIPGMPEFEPGAEEFLFVTTDSRICPLVGAMHGRYRVLTAQKPNRPYIARDDRAPLVDVGDIPRPMDPHTVRTAEAGNAISPEAFEDLIAREVARSRSQEVRR